MKLFTDNGKCGVPFEFNAKTVALNATRYTTFHDVVHMLTHKAGITKSTARLYAVYECTADLERKISGEVRVLNIWRSWGCGTSNFRFVVKLPGSNISLKYFNRSSTAKAEEEVDILLSQSYKEANTHTWTEHVTDSIETMANSSVNRHSETGSRTSQRNNESGGKRALLTKYLKDLKIFSKRKSKKTSQALGKKERADGAEVPEVHVGRYVEGREDPDVPVRTYLDSTHISIENCRYHWDKHCHSDTDSDSDSDSDTSDDFNDSVLESDHESDVSYTSSLSRNVRALDRAFVQSSRYSESDEGIDVTSMTSSDLNTAFVADLERQCAADEEYSELVDSVDDFDKNISTSDYVRKLFGADDVESVSSQDDKVDSFMRSRLDSF